MCNNLTIRLACTLAFVIINSLNANDISMQGNYDVEN